MKAVIENSSAGSEHRTARHFAAVFVLHTAFVCLSLCALCGYALGQDASSAPKLTAPATKEFTLTLRYNYQELKYDPVVVVPFIAAKPANLNSVEDALVSHLSAMKNLDYDWWLSTWDAASRSQIVERDKAANRTKDDYLKEWKQRFGSVNQVTLTRWMLSGGYVILAHRLGASATPVNKLPENATAFVTAEGLWRPTLTLDGDPVLTHFADDKKIFEKMIR